MNWKNGMNWKDGMNWNVKSGGWNGQLYDAGNEYTEKTGGWIVGHGLTNFDRAIAIKNPTNIYLLYDSQPGYSGLSWAQTVNSFDLTNYTKIKATINVTEFSGAEQHFYLLSGYAVYLGSTVINSTGERTIEYDITSQNISGIIQCYCQSANSSYLGFTISKIWLE